MDMSLPQDQSMQQHCSGDQTWTWIDSILLVKFFILVLDLVLKVWEPLVPIKHLGNLILVVHATTKRAFWKFIWYICSKGITAQNTRDGSEISFSNTSLGFHKVLWIYAWYCDWHSWYNPDFQWVKAPNWDPHKRPVNDGFWIPLRSLQPLRIPKILWICIYLCTNLRAGGALSETKKKQLVREVEDGLWAQAVEAYWNELVKPAGVKRQSAQTIAKDITSLFRCETGKHITLDYSYLCHHAPKTMHTKSKFNAAKSWLMTEEMEVVIDYAIECEDWGFPLSHCHLQEHVNEILQARLGDMFPEGGVGQKWMNQFVEKHSCCLKTSWSSPLESKCGCAVNEHNLTTFYNLLDKLITKHNLIPENMHGTDGVGTNTANSEREWVIGGWKCVGPQYQQQGGNHENITIMVIIPGDGSSIPPAVIYKGLAFQVWWKQDNPANAS